MLAMSLYGYVRVSTAEQNVMRQTVAMHEQGVDPKNVYIDKQSGKDFNRPAYQKMLRKLKVGDVLIIKSIDRLGRNYDEILEQWRYITKEKQVSIFVIDMPLLDTRRDKDLVGTLISDIILQLLSYVAQTEREFIRQRQAEGIAAARMRGTKFGREPKARPPEYEELKSQYLAGEISARKASEKLGVCHATFLKWVKTDI